MSLALCMVLKDQANHIAGCLEPIIDLLDEVVIIDTGSTDGTPQLIRQRFGIEVQHGQQEASRCYCLCDLKNRAFGQASADWILVLDADERIRPQSLAEFRQMKHAADTDGYFCRWSNYLQGEPAFEDYKLFLFRRGFQTRGLLHDNVQIDIREKGGRAAWLAGMEVDHFPDAARMEDKTRLYRERLQSALRMEPGWHRHHWFLGYMNFQAGNTDAATRHLMAAANSSSPLFPVERLNSGMVLAEIYARQHDHATLGRHLEAMRGYYSRMAGDFEVAINFRLPGWIARSERACAAGEFEAIRAYRFAR